MRLGFVFALLSWLGQDELSGTQEEKEKADPAAAIGTYAQDKRGFGITHVNAGVVLRA